MGYKSLPGNENFQVGDNELFTLGDDGSGVLIYVSGATTANAAITDVIEGTSVHQAYATGTQIVSNVNNDGDIAMLVSDGGHSKEFLFANGDSADLQIGHGMATATLKTASGAITLSPTTDTLIANGTGLVIGHTGQETISIGDGATDLVPEVQVLGTGQVDASLMLAAYSTTATAAGAPLIALVKGGNATIGSHTVVTDGEELGNIIAYGDDGTDLEAVAAQIQFEVDGTPGTGDMPGRIVFATTADGAETATERMRITKTGQVLIGDTTNANNTFGLTIHQGTADDFILTFKESGIATGLTDGPMDKIVETDDFFTIKKISAGNGGVVMSAYLMDSGSSTGMLIESYGGTFQTGDATNSTGAVMTFAAEHDGSNALIDNPANGNCFAVTAYLSSARTTHLIVKGDDGELHVANTTLVALDDEDDIQIVRSLQRESSSDSVQLTDDENPFYSYSKLRELHLIGPKDDRGMCLFPLQPRLHAHEGAIWQLYLKHMAVAESHETRLNELEQENVALRALVER
jgi:hypothetical protein